MKSAYTFLVWFLLSSFMLAQQVERVEPPFWWVGMVNPELQLMVYGKDVSKLEVIVEADKGVELAAVTRLKNKNYLIIDLEVSADAKPDKFSIEFKKGKKAVHQYLYELKSRQPGSAMREGFNSSDVIYLITPDRFANGDASNDAVKGLREKSDRADKDGRHGGDIRGIIKNLDYIKEMGFTAIWLNPVLENDMPKYSYHGYAATDFYKTDARLGSNEDYRMLSEKAREKGIKLITDMILNHCGVEHWWMKDLPTPDWVNFQETYLQGDYVYTNHAKVAIQDPYASEADRALLADGWFWSGMPDLNQRNPYLGKYLLQNTIWWIEYSGISGIRMDTYPYPDADYMTEWTCRVIAEYPNFNIVGEEWHENPAIVSHWQRGKQHADGTTASCLPALMDFPLRAKLINGLLEKESQISGWISVYEMLANDFQYADPANLVVFADNHDVNRIFTDLGENLGLFKLAMTYLLTMRGIPQIFYGTEILMANPDGYAHGTIRSDFPGGWQGDPVNAFTGQGLSEQQKTTQNFLRKLLNWRKNKPVIHRGKLMHFQPKDGIYVFFRYDKNEIVMIVLSKNTETKTLALDRFAEILGDATKGREVVSGENITLGETLTIPPMDALVIEINR